MTKSVVVDQRQEHSVLPTAFRTKATCLQTESLVTRLRTDIKSKCSCRSVWHILPSCRLDMVLKSSLIATVAIRIAPNLANEIIDQLQDDSFSLRHCSLVSKTWRERALKWLFAAIVMQFTATNPWSYLHWFEEPTPGTSANRP